MRQLWPFGNWSTRTLKNRNFWTTWGKAPWISSLIFHPLHYGMENQVGIWIEQYHRFPRYINEAAWGCPSSSTLVLLSRCGNFNDIFSPREFNKVCLWRNSGSQCLSPVTCACQSESCTGTDKGKLCDLNCNLMLCYAAINLDQDAWRFWAARLWVLGQGSWLSWKGFDFLEVWTFCSCLWLIPHWLGVLDCPFVLT